MKKITEKDLLKLTSVNLVNKKLFSRHRVIGISTDSRSVGKANIFFALHGDHFDAHNFIGDVVKHDVAAIVIRKEWAEKNAARLKSFPCACIIVPDVIIALGELARIYRRKFDIPVIAIGGSNGKTTTKEMVTAVLKAKYAVLNTEGNLNNHIGVPQTLFRLTSDHDMAVIELGTNHFGELSYLCKIAEPTHGLLTNIGKEHLEFFGDENGVAKEEKELFRFLEQHDGFAFINSDDRYLEDESKNIKKSMSFGTISKADVRAKNITMNALGQATFQCKWLKKDISMSVNLSVPGIHNVSNALAAVSVGLKMKVKEKKIINALKNFSSASKRMEIFSHNGVTILNDTYNSNPDSVIVALKTLQSLTTNGKKIAVLADMRELGESSKREHTNIGVIAAEMKFSHLFTYGPFSKYTNEAYNRDNGKHFESKDELAEVLNSILHSGDVVLVKGSRGMRMEDVVAHLTAVHEHVTMN
ncbi:MAG: UDP-N-acetylmuramoyl-tripeptide--D-alanyl-D-alanine ligase [Bacteroidota bacterium]|nr:UDP-N-acetylmuramoyl-tripeptide--D-alanyl-D-alanine ligase [Bacteroidota bacterium]